MSMKWRGVILVSTLMTWSLMGAQAAGAAPPAPADSSEALVAACSAEPISYAQPWVLEYHWDGGLGPGSVHLKLSSDGSAILTSAPTGGKSSDRSLTIPPSAMAKLRAALTKSPLACVHTQIRKGYVVFDLGQYMLKLTHGGKVESAYVDQCHAVDDAAKFSTLVDAVQGLEPFLGDAIKWGPFATTSMESDSCGSKRPAK